MPIITISRWSHSKGQEIAEKVARRLGYRCISRRILLEASEEFNIPEVKLERALHDAPSVLDRFTHGKEKYVTYIRRAFLEEVQGDNVVYHGLAGQFFVRGVSHVLKVRIFADFEQRVKEEMEREGLSRREAVELLKKDDDERRKWAKALYGIDCAQPELYDLVIHLAKLGVDDAVDIICSAAEGSKFQTTRESQAVLDRLVLAARAKSVLVAKWPKVEVAAVDGEIRVDLKAALIQEPSAHEEITRLIEPLPGIDKVKVHVNPTLFSV